MRAFEREIADLIEREAMLFGRPDRATCEQLATKIMLRLLGDDDDEAGLLDNYRLAITDTEGAPLVGWLCPRAHGAAGTGHVCVNARGLADDGNLEQKGVTLSEIVRSALEHETEEIH